jgi:L-seryl-tRNA(Ser) seleniumtransferase
VTTHARPDLYRQLPSVDDLLRNPELTTLASQEGQSAVTDAARTVLANLRATISEATLDEAGIALALTGLPAAVARQLRQNLRHSLRPVINATGVILHTNLGRAPLSPAALDHIRETAATYSNLEFDLSRGERGHRDVHVDRLFRKLLADVGAGVTARERSSPPVTIVVNNNAAAVLLALNTLADQGEVIVSRGELVEIGGSFRIPDVMAKSNAILHEIGTTNRTRIADYERAINDKTRLLLRVHRSNFEITGFTEQPTLRELTDLARRRNIPLMEDLGSGALFDLRSIGIDKEGEHSVLWSLDVGVDIVSYSGDKLLGGPQAGILSGRSDLIARMRSNSLFRALRADKLTYAALEATLLSYIKEDHNAIPALRMMRLSKAEISLRAEALARDVPKSSLSVEILDGESVIGGGAAPTATLPTRLLALTHRNLSADELSAAFRSFDPPIVARVEEGRVLLDLRTVFPAQDEILASAMAALPSTMSS